MATKKLENMNEKELLITISKQLIGIGIGIALVLVAVWSIWFLILSS